MPATGPHPEAPPPADWPSPFPPDVAFRQAGGALAAAAAAAALLAQERALLSARATARRVQEFALGRACAHAALAALEPRRAAELAAAPILRDDARRPRWPEGFVGSITHHRGYAAAAVGRARDYLGLGVDLEAVRAPSPELVRRVLREEERALWEQMAPGTRDEGFMRLFSAKESLFKALYPHTGVYLGFQDAALEPLDETPESPGRVPIRWRLHKACGPAFPLGSAGVGSALSQGGFVLSAVWVRREEA
jgi:enterobactin synthetase component D / holo-[acyl-carrier protein] synthase